MSTLALYRITTIACALVIINATIGAALSLSSGDTTALGWQATTVAGFALALMHMRRPATTKEAP